MRALLFSLVTLGTVAGCADFGILSGPPDIEPQPVSSYPVRSPGPDTVRPKPRPDKVIPKVIPPSAQNGELGRSVVSLGTPADRGLWVETPLVSSVRAGRVIRTDTGAELAVELRPGPPGGARASLQTLMGLGLSPAALNELVIASP